MFSASKISSIVGNSIVFIFSDLMYDLIEQILEAQIRIVVENSIAFVSLNVVERFDKISFLLLQAQIRLKQLKIASLSKTICERFDTKD